MSESKSWWDRNWYWVLGAGCLVPILACGGCFGLSALFIRSKVANFSPYKDAVAMATADPRVVAELGEPIETGWSTQSQVQIHNDSGRASLSIPLEGPKGSGTLRVKASRADGVWNFDRLTVRIDGIDEAIDLLEGNGEFDLPESEGEIEDGTETGPEPDAAQGGVEG
ncbi:MAG: cytochrome c oxidase assembly factor Coa1 family protein [Acidobacteriota bacterium]|nr:cytochrome c oxidase assembly factor Coa1 family protein [Acidobacteriota bacterium]